MQVRRVLGGVSRRAHVTEDLPLADLLAFGQTVGIAIEVGVVVAEPLGRVELVDGDAAGLAVEQAGDVAGLDRLDRGVVRGEDVDRFVRASAAGVRELARQLILRRCLRPG